MERTVRIEQPRLNLASFLLLLISTLAAKICIPHTKGQKYDLKYLQELIELAASI